MGHHDTAIALQNIRKLKRGLTVAIGFVLGALLCEQNPVSTLLCGAAGALLGYLADIWSGSLDDWYDAECGGGGGMNWTVDVTAQNTETKGWNFFSGNYSYSYKIAPIFRSLHKRCNKYSD